eukprot:365052-Chlamydomonas_euryale.AAC.34
MYVEFARCAAQTSTRAGRYARNGVSGIDLFHMQALTRPGRPVAPIARRPAHIGRALPCLDASSTVARTAASRITSPTHRHVLQKIAAAQDGDVARPSREVSPDDGRPSTTGSRVDGVGGWVPDVDQPRETVSPAEASYSIGMERSAESGELAQARSLPPAASAAGAMDVPSEPAESLEQAKLADAYR